MFPRYLSLGLIDIRVMMKFSQLERLKLSNYGNTGPVLKNDVVNSLKLSNDNIGSCMDIAIT